MQDDRDNRHPVLLPPTCEGCGKPLQMRPAEAPGRPARWCSDACRHREARRRKAAVRRMMGRENTLGELDQARQDLATLRAEISDAVDTLTRERPPEDATTAELVAELRASVASIDREYADAMKHALRLERARLAAIAALKDACAGCATGSLYGDRAQVERAIALLGALGGGDDE